METRRLKSKPLGYTTIPERTWLRVRNEARKMPGFTVHIVESGVKFLIIRDQDDRLIMDLGSLPDKDYFWVAFSLESDAYDLLEKAFSH